MTFKFNNKLSFPQYEETLIYSRTPLHSMHLHQHRTAERPTAQTPPPRAFSDNKRRNKTTNQTVFCSCILSSSLDFSSLPSQPFPFLLRWLCHVWVPTLFLGGDLAGTCCPSNSPCQHTGLSWCGFGISKPLQQLPISIPVAAAHVFLSLPSAI